MSLAAHNAALDEGVELKIMLHLLDRKSDKIRMSNLLRQTSLIPQTDPNCIISDLSFGTIRIRLWVNIGFLYYFTYSYNVIRTIGFDRYNPDSLKVDR